jgi:hypothetical protein
MNISKSEQQESDEIVEPGVPAALGMYQIRVGFYDSFIN